METYKNNNSKNSSRLFSAILALQLVFSVYVVSFAKIMNYGEVLLGIAVLYLIIKNKKVYVYNNKVLMGYLGYCIVLTISMTLLYNLRIVDSASRLIRDGFYWSIVCIFGYSYFDYDYFLHFVKRIGIALSLVIIIQEILYLAAGQYYSFLIPNAYVAAEETGAVIANRTLAFAYHAGYLKANGFLVEAAHCSQALFFISIILITSYIESFNKKELLTIILFSLASLMTFSVSGLIYMLLVWFLVVLLCVYYGKIRKQIGGILIILIILILFLSIYLIYSGFDFLSPIWDRLFNAHSILTADNATFMRLYKGFVFWNELPLFNKVFGIGFGNYDAFVSMFDPSFAFNNRGEYMSSLSYLLISCGCVGVVLLFSFFASLWRNTPLIGKLLIISLFIMSVSASIYSSTFWLWHLLTIINFEKKNRMEKNNEFI